MRLLYPFILFHLMLAPLLNAAAPNKPELDGRIIEYDAVDLRGTFSGSPAWAGASMTNLFVTWDVSNLYVAVQCRMQDTKIAVLIDVDPGNGTGATTTTNWVNNTNVMFRYNDVGWKKSSHPSAKSFGLDYMLATEGFFNSVLRVIYNGIQIPSTNTGNRLFDIPDVGNGDVPVGTAVEMVVLKDSTSNSLKGFEARLPWNVLYGANTNRFGFIGPGNPVPTGAVIRLFANIHNNLPTLSFSSPDVIPAQISSNASYHAGTGLLTSDDYIDVVIDGNLDGFPDLATGDVNAPYLVNTIGISGSSSITGIFSEAVTESTAVSISNWTINGASIQDISFISPNRVTISITGLLPAAGTFLPIQTMGIQDHAGNSRITHAGLTTRSKPFLSSYNSMTVAGDFQGWNPSATNMTPFKDFMWLGDLPVNSSSGMMFKFAANGSWDTNFGHGSAVISALPLASVAGSFSGANIQLTNVLNGVFRFIFNEKTRAFSVVKNGNDSDADSLPDEWETLNGFVPTDDGTVSIQNGAEGDVDGDYVNNRTEFIGDTDPRDGLFFPVVNEIVRTNLVEISFSSSTNRLYNIDTANDLSQFNWAPLLPDHIPGTGMEMTISDTNATGTSLYRVRVIQP